MMNVELCVCESQFLAELAETGWQGIATTSVEGANPSIETEKERDDVDVTSPL